MEQLRQPSVAGLFYPVDAEQLRSQVARFLELAPHEAIHPKALIAPHAGYPYSGPIAASAYAQIEAFADQIHKVVLLGPAHRVAFQGLACSSADRFLTPLGPVTVDTESLALIRDLPQITRSELPFNGEHSLEVHLPFLQATLERFELIPLLVGDARPREVAEVLERLWDGDETLIVVSSDLSHYLDYDSAQVLDRETSRAIERLDGDAISHYQACGRNPINGLLLAARHHDLHAKTLDLRNSGDTAGSRSQVVGYGAYAFV